MKKRQAYEGISYEIPTFFTKYYFFRKKNSFKKKINIFEIVNKMFITFYFILFFATTISMFFFGTECFIIFLKNASHLYIFNARA